MTIHSEVGERFLELTKPLLEEIHKRLGERGKGKGKEAYTKRGNNPQCLSARGFFKTWLGHARSVSTRYPVVSLRSHTETT